MCGSPPHSPCAVYRPQSTCGSKGGADAIDVGDDRAGHRRFRNLAVVHEAVLQIDDDVRGLVRDQGIEHCDATTVARNPLANLVEDVGLMHGLHSSANCVPKFVSPDRLYPWAD